MNMLSADSAALRGWVLLTGLAGLGAALGAFRKPSSPHSTLYSNSKDTNNASFARMYATWLFTSTAIRVAFYFANSRHPATTTIFWLAFTTYLIALFHFVSEIFVFRTAALLPGGFMPLLVAGFSIVWFSLVAVGSIL